MRFIAEFLGGAGLAVALAIGTYRLLGVFQRGLQNKPVDRDQKGSDQ